MRQCVYPPRYDAQYDSLANNALWNRPDATTPAVRSSQQLSAIGVPADIPTGTLSVLSGNIAPCRQVGWTRTQVASNQLESEPSAIAHRADGPGNRASELLLASSGTPGGVPS